MPRLPGSAVDRRAYFLVLRQKKVAKEKATPGYAVGCADSPARLDGPGGCATRADGPQTVLADCPQPVCVARRSTWGPEKHRKPTAKDETKGGEAAPGLPDPLGGAEQRRVVGGCRLALFEPQASLASRPTARVAQGSPHSGAMTQGRLFFGYFLLAKQKKVRPRVRRGKQRLRKPSRQPASGDQTTRVCGSSPWRARIRPIQ